MCFYCHMKIVRAAFKCFCSTLITEIYSQVTRASNLFSALYLKNELFAHYLILASISFDTSNTIVVDSVLP